MCITSEQKLRSHVLPYSLFTPLPDEWKNLQGEAQDRKNLGPGISHKRPSTSYLSIGCDISEKQTSIVKPLRFGGLFIKAISVRFPSA